MINLLDDLESSVRGYVRSFPTVFATASGCWMYNEHAKKYLDFFSCAGALNYGHNHPLVKAAILEYVARDGILHSLDMATEAKLAFIQAFQETILKPRRLNYKFQFTGPTGTNAVEAAIKLARKAKNRSHVVAFTNAYHGHTLGSLSLTGNRYYHNGQFGSHNNVTHLPFDGYLGSMDTTELLDKMLRDNSSGLPLPAAVIVETVQGEGGVRVASSQWLRNLSRICEYNDIALIVDDIQVGIGRTGSFFSFEPSGIQPAIVCLSKSIAAGIPMSMLLLRPDLDVWNPGEHTGTFRGNNLAFVAARECLRLWENDAFQKNIKNSSRHLESRLRKLVSQFPGLNASIRGRGMIWGLDLGDGQHAKRISKRAFELGLILETAGADDQVLKFLPPLIISPAEVDYGMAILTHAISEVTSSQPTSFPVAELTSSTTLNNAATATV